MRCGSRKRSTAGDVELPKGAPDFYDARSDWAACRWIGPGRGWIDPVKEVQASQMKIDAACRPSRTKPPSRAGLGGDPRAARLEQQELKELGLQGTGQQVYRVNSARAGDERGRPRESACASPMSPAAPSIGRCCWSRGAAMAFLASLAGLIARSTLDRRFDVDRLRRWHGTTTTASRRPTSSLPFGIIEWERGKCFAQVEGVAVLEIDGTLVNKNGSLQPYCGMTGYDGIRTQLMAAMMDPLVKGIALYVESPGGEVAGCFDLANFIRDRRGGKADLGRSSTAWRRRPPMRWCRAARASRRVRSACWDRSA
jgi:hypothetical protein